MTPEELAKAAPYRPRGAALDLFYAREEEVLLDGPAGTGKTLACLNKVLAMALKYSLSRHLVLRKTRASLTESALVTFENEVVPPGHMCLDGAGRANRHSYEFPNGSSIVLGGMDKVSRVMSTQYDSIYILEAVELEEAEWEGVSTRLRNGKMPFAQLLADTNPDRPTHWLNQRCLAGLTRRLWSRHEDNPRFWDAATGAWTEEGLVYLSRLDRLTGARLQRLRFGKWAASEGQIYEQWDSPTHLMQRRDLPKDWRRLWTFDFGFTNPLVWQCWAIDPDGRYWREWELYRTKTLVEDAAREILAHCASVGSPRPVAVVCDHDAEDRATLERHLGYRTVAAVKDVSPGIQAVASRLRKADDGLPRLLLLRDSLIHPRDPDLFEAKRPTCTDEEFDAYVWDTTAGRKRGEQPLKEHDHGMDGMRYGVAWSDLRKSAKVRAD